jgi:hypothetical protein
MRRQLLHLAGAAACSFVPGVTVVNIFFPDDLAYSLLVA